MTRFIGRYGIYTLILMAAAVVLMWICFMLSMPEPSCTILASKPKVQTVRWTGEKIYEWNTKEHYSWEIGVRDNGTVMVRKTGSRTIK